MCKDTGCVTDFKQALNYVLDQHDMIVAVSIITMPRSRRKREQGADAAVVRLPHPPSH